MTTKRAAYNLTALLYQPRQFMYMLIALMCLMLPLQHVHAAEAQSAGKVIFVFGQAWKLANDGGKYDVKRGMEVKVGEVIETSPTGQVQIRMNDNGLISIRPSSQFKIKSFKFSGLNGEDRSGDKTYFQLLKGGFRSITGAVGEHNKKAYKVSTPVATIGIRGTDYSARLCSGDCSRPDGLYIGVWRGGVSLTNNVSVLNVDAGHFGFVPDVNIPGQAVDSVPAGMLLASGGVRTNQTYPANDAPVTTMAELAANDAPVFDTSVSLPSTGTASYNLASLSGSDNLGNSVTGGSATLTADFGNLSVDANLHLNMSDSSSWDGAASNLALGSNGSFSGAMSSVNPSDGIGNSIPGTTTGEITNGSLTGLGNGTVPTGAGFDYSMSVSSGTTTTVNGSASLTQ